jgi:hypothetical protein
VMTPTSFKSVERPFFRVMVTGWIIISNAIVNQDVFERTAVESPPIQVRVTGEPAVTTEGGNPVNCRVD